MKKACLVLRKTIDIGNVETSSVLDAFSNVGYAFDDVRFLPITQEKNIEETLVSMKKQSDVLLVLADSSCVSLVYTQVEKLYANAASQAAFGEAKAYQDQECICFLLLTDKKESGLDLVKSACVPYLEKSLGIRTDTIILRSVGANESRVESLISQVARFGSSAISCSHHRRYDEDIVRISYDGNAPKMLVDDVLRSFAEGLGDTLYAMNDVSLEEQVISILKLRQKKLSVAESFTGGGVAKRITSVSGASEVYFEGLNTYNEHSKIKRLGVSEYTLRSQGAVSEQTAYEMVRGLLNTQDCDIAVATTGLAGPKSDRSLLPVGLCYIAVGTRERIRVYRYVFEGDRKTVTEKAINYALFYVYKQLKDL